MDIIEVDPETKEMLKSLVSTMVTHLVVWHEVLWCLQDFGNIPNLQVTQQTAAGGGYGGRR